MASFAQNNNGAPLKKMDAESELVKKSLVPGPVYNLSATEEHKYVYRSDSKIYVIGSENGRAINNLQNGENPVNYFQYSFPDVFSKQFNVGTFPIPTRRLLTKTM